MAARRHPGQQHRQRLATPEPTQAWTQVPVSVLRARLALTPPPIQLPRGATQQAKPEQLLRNQRQRRHRLCRVVVAIS